MPVQPLGWFKKDIKSRDDLKGISYRAEGLAADLFQELGASVTILPSGEIVPAMDRGLLDAAALNNPSSDLQLGLPEVAKVLHDGQPSPAGRAPSRSFSTRASTMLCRRRSSRSCATPHWRRRPRQLGMAYARYPKDLEEIRKRGVDVARTGDAVLRAQLAAWDKVDRGVFQGAVLRQGDRLAKGLGQAALQPYLAANNLGSGELAVAYKHFFG